MEKRTREKVALVVFALLVAFALAVLTSYFATGRSWNVAASVVDDTVGQMKGYTALVYAGIASPDAAEELRDDEAAATLEEPDVTDSVGLGILALLPPLPGEYEGVYVSDVRDLYEHKEAAVISLDVAHPERYAAPCVLTAGDKRIGVFSVSSYATGARLQQYRESFEALAVDAVVAIAPRSAMLADLDEVAVVVVTNDEEASSVGSFQGDTLVVAAAPRDAVGVVLLSPTNVPAAKVVSVL